MKHPHARILAVAVALISIVVGAAGCSPTKEYASSLETYNAALSGLIEARKAGKLSDTQYRRAEAARVVAAAALDKLKEASASGNQFDAAGALRGFADAMEQVHLAGAAPNGRD